ncbi:hypothetical protein [Vibrio paucivorans]
MPHRSNNVKLFSFFVFICLGGVVLVALTNNYYSSNRLSGNIRSINSVNFKYVVFVLDSNKLIVDSNVTFRGELYNYTRMLEFDRLDQNTYVTNEIGFITSRAEIDDKILNDDFFKSVQKIHLFSLGNDSVVFESNNKMLILFKDR